MKKRECHSCGEQYLLVFFRFRDSTRRVPRNTCIGCEQTRRDARKKTNRHRVKAVNIRSSHSRRLKIPIPVMEREYGWDVDVIEHDLRHAMKNGCRYCEKSFSSMVEELGMSAVTLDMRDPDSAPYWKTNTVFCCATCNKEKQRTSPSDWGAKLQSWKIWEERQKALRRNDFTDLPLFKNA